jgi:GntR family transcriptional regulator
VIESIVLDEESCDRLSVRAASNGILLTRQTFDEDGRCVEFARDVYRADRAAFEVSASVAR